MKLLLQILITCFIMPMAMALPWIQSDRYFISDAFEQVDRNINSQFKASLNKLFVKENGYQFGDKMHTVSYVIGRNKLTKTLTPAGESFDQFLERLQRLHTLQSVLHEENLCGPDCNHKYKSFFSPTITNYQ